MKNLINKITKNIILPSIIYAGFNSLIYGQEKKMNDSIASPKIIKIIDSNGDSLPDKYLILEDLLDSVSQMSYIDIDFNGIFDLLNLDYYDKKKFSIKSLSHIIENDKEISDSYREFKIGEHFINCKKDDIDRLSLIIRLSKKDSSKTFIRSVDNNKDGFSDEYYLWEESKENIFSSKYLDADYNKNFDLLILTEYDKKTGNILEKLYNFKGKFPELFEKLKPEESIGSKEGYVNIKPTKIQALDVYPKDGIYDKYVLWQDLPDKIMQIKFSDQYHNGNFDVLGYSYDKKTNGVKMEIPRDYAEKIMLIKSLDLKEGDNFFYCNKNYFKTSISDYIKKE
ncbi:MAG: hypothetical protein AABY06_00615 [Nanoarchaeota archaeon]